MKQLRSIIQVELVGGGNIICTLVNSYGGIGGGGGEHILSLLQMELLYVQ